jgi:hypothetical protein
MEILTFRALASGVSVRKWGEIMSRLHRYDILLRWTGNTETGTSAYRDYRRAHVIGAVGREELAVSAGVALALHERAGSMCFIARSLNFPVDHEPVVTYLNE